MSAAVLTASAGSMLEKQRQKEQDDSGSIFPKLGAKITGETLLRHPIDDIYRSSYSKAYDVQNMALARTQCRPLSGRRNRPHPRKDWLMWHAPQQPPRLLKSTEDGGLWDSVRNNIDCDLNKYETEYSRLYSGSPGYKAYSERQRLLNREEVAKAKLPKSSDVDIQPPGSPPSKPQFSGSSYESYSDLNKFLGSDIMQDKEIIKEILESNDQRYLIKFLKTLSPETLLGLQKWLQANREEEKENEEDGEGTDVDGNSSKSPPPSPAKDQASFGAENETSRHKKLRVTSFEGTKKLIKKLISSAERSEIEQLLCNMIKPEEVTGVTHWLISQDEKDREVALRFLGEVRFKPNKDYERVRESLEKLSPSPPLLRRRKKRPPHGKNCACSICDADHNNRILRALYNQGSSSVIDEMRKALDCIPQPKRTVIRQQNQRKNQVAKLGGENLITRNVPKYIPNKKALFMQPHRIMPAYFVIHPELP